MSATVAQSWGCRLCAALALLTLASPGAAAKNGGSYLMVHFDHHIEYTPDYPDPEYYIDLFRESCPGIGADSCDHYLEYRDCHYGVDLNPTLMVEAAAIHNNPPEILWICAVLPDTCCAEIAAAEFGIAAIEGDVEFLDYGHAGSSQMHTPDWPAVGAGIRVWYDPPLSDHVVPLIWIALKPVADGRVTLGPAPWGVAARLWSADSQAATVVEDYPLAGCILPGYNADPEMPFARVCCVGGDCLLLAEEACHSLGGFWRPDLGRNCVPSPCPPSPASATSWGALKSIYR